MRRLLAWSLFSAVLCCGAGASDQGKNEQVKVEQTTDRENEGLGQFLRKSALSLSIDGNGAHFQMRPNGARFRLGDPEKCEETDAGWKFQLNLCKPGMVIYSPDHHGRKIFTVKRITADGILLEYFTTFDHRSFGENLITQDRGEIELHPFSNP